MGALIHGCRSAWGGSVPAVLTPVEVVPTPGGGRAASSNTVLHKQLRLSIVISAARCLLTYVVVPILSPLIQPTFGRHPGIATALSVTALVFDARAVRRAWRSDHRWRLQIVVGYGLLMLGIAGLLAHDVWQLVQ